MFLKSLRKNTHEKIAIMAFTSLSVFLTACSSHDIDEFKSDLNEVATMHTDRAQTVTP